MLGLDIRERTRLFDRICGGRYILALRKCTSTLKEGKTADQSEEFGRNLRGRSAEESPGLSISLA